MKRSTITQFGLAVLAVATLAPMAAAQAPRPFEKLVFPKLHEIKTPAVMRATLPDGMKLILVEDHDLPLVSFRAIVRGGRIAEPQDEAGLAELFGEAQRTGGTATMSGDEVDQALDRLGASVETNVSQAYGEVTANTLTEHVDEVLPIFVQFLTSPAFAQDKIDLAKTHMRGMIARRNDNVQGIARREIQKLVYGANSPYARQYEYDDVNALTRDDLVAFHDRYYRPDTTILTAWGDFKAPEMKARLEAAFADWKAEGPPPTVAVPAVEAQPPTLNYIEKKDIEQTFILMGELGMRYDDPDYPAVNLMSDILGGGFSSRIFVKVRTEKGLAYGAGGWMMPAYDHPGSFFFYTSTKPSTTVEALNAMMEQIKGIREGLVTDAELKRAKDGYLNSYAFEYDSTSKIVNRLATYELYGYPADFNKHLRDAVEKVSKEDILRVARQRLDPAALTILAIGRQDKFDKPLSTVGKVNTIDITIPEPKPKEAVAEASADSLAKGKDLLLKAAHAMGEDALRQLKEIESEGSTTVNSPMGTMELKGKATFVLPDKLHNEMTTPMGAMVQVLAGDTGWMQMGPRTRDLPASATAEMKRGLYTEAGCALLLQEALAGKLEGQALGQAQFEGSNAEDVLVHLGDTPYHLYIAPDSGEVLGTKHTANTQEGPQEVVEVFGDRQEVSGLRIPFSATQKVKGEVKAASKLTSVKINAGYAEDLFSKPPAPPAQ
jgi:zinc protease